MTRQIHTKMPSFESLVDFQNVDNVEEIYLLCQQIYKDQIELFKLIEENYKHSNTEDIAMMFSDFSELLINISVQCEEGMINKKIVKRGSRYKKQWFKI
jgi:hypothetical protein